MEFLLLSLRRPAALLWAGAWATACAAPPALPAGRPAQPASTELREPAPASSDAPASSAVPASSDAPASSATPASSEAPASSATPASSAAVPDAAGPREPLPLPEGTTVLHIGDSMAGALGVELNLELKKHKVRGILRSQTSSYIPGWAWGKQLPLYLAHHNPDLVLITLGTNEMKIADPSQRIPNIKKLIQKLDGRPCVWIAPPVWTTEKGLYEVIRENIAPCRYMDTEVVYPDMPRLNDKIHPSIRARRIWAQRVVEWLARERRPTTDRPWALAPE